jgi:transcriptional regulator with XRE-family HTH domain
MTTEALEKLATQVGISRRTLFRWRQALRKDFAKDLRWHNFLNMFIAALGNSMQENANTISKTLLKIFLLRGVPLNPVDLILSFVGIFFESPFELSNMRPVIQAI